MFDQGLLKADVKIENEKNIRFLVKTSFSVKSNCIGKSSRIKILLSSNLPDKKNNVHEFYVLKLKKFYTSFMI